MVCTLCKHPAVHFGNFQNRNYNRCTYCASVFLDSIDLPSASREEKRYQQHQNSTSNSGYIDFLSPLITVVTKNHGKAETGLDYGSGPNPVLTNLLKNRGFVVTAYDLFFSKNPDALQQSYDYVLCCEVIEHFHKPAESFRELFDLLKPGGSLYCKTNLLTPDINFKDWWYKNDFTHSFFYTTEALAYIRSHFGFTNLILKSDYIQFIK
ncbi:class I SAM-dependent methyltransferase [Leeuwenhoekiella sp. H156]|uniref:class I SAM-dependent methyltransferase n=1 Tax=Leeuwenhoekiella sp. H156 TaxID=3450128 RepID=UPI003FA4B3C0